MKRPRRNLYLDDDVNVALEHYSVKCGLSKSATVDRALREFFSPDREDLREAAFTRRFNDLARQVERVDHDLNVLTETLAIYIRYYLSVVPPVPEAHQEAARAQGKARFQQFIEQLARHLQRGNSLAHDLHDELFPKHAQRTDADGTHVADRATDILP